MFWAHGNYELKKDSNILYVTASGPFNRETIIALKRDLPKVINELSGSPWGEIAVLKNECAYTPEALEELLKSFQDRTRKNLVAIAIVFQEAECRALARYQLESIFKLCTYLKWKFCEDIQSARSWCDAILSGSAVH
ncbi:hypothetical protein [Alteromonas sp. ASW11-130]|uniref:hypothetical protein n=1 Tax=Alteromonas sp. ASW11-130 TaxID=3015775 RepID=UPI002242B3C1|nr:hypothetical protein [Alteromonas sp. ASW11-130]MCW8091587.1 hypothetical protein [Alteromonas sp. ASW11-130]